MGFLNPLVQEAEDILDFLGILSPWGPAALHLPHSRTRPGDPQGISHFHPNPKDIPLKSQSRKSGWECPATIPIPRTSHRYPSPKDLGGNVPLPFQPQGHPTEIPIPGIWVGMSHCHSQSQDHPRAIPIPNIWEGMSHCYSSSKDIPLKSQSQRSVSQCPTAIPASRISQ